LQLHDVKSQKLPAKAGRQFVRLPCSTAQFNEFEHRMMSPVTHLSKMSAVMPNNLCHKLQPLRRRAAVAEYHVCRCPGAAPTKLPSPPPHTSDPSLGVVPSGAATARNARVGSELPNCRPKHVRNAPPSLVRGFASSPALCPPPRSHRRRPRVGVDKALCRRGAAARPIGRAAAARGARPGTARKLLKHYY